MRRYQQSQPGVFLRGNELMRLMTMVGMLGVLLLLIVRSADPHTWSWLTNDKGTSPAWSSSASADHQNDENANNDDNNNGQNALIPPEDNKTGQSSALIPAGAAKEPLLASDGPTDLDPEEAEAIHEEFQAVADAKISIGREEMPAYNRLLQWIQNQTLSDLRRRAKKDPAFTQFYQSPDKYRGQLFELKLNVRRILKYAHKDLALYEVWGWTAESRSWPYVGVVIDLPKGMPIGPDVYETATLVGYFFKMQGYMEAGARPRAAPLQAPLFVGRLIWYRDATPPAQSTDWSWGLFLLAGFVIFLIIRWGLFLRGSRHRILSPSNVPVKPSGNQVEDWLANVEKDVPVQGDEEAKNP
jgi:hypothetical protein